MAEELAHEPTPTPRWVLAAVAVAAVAVAGGLLTRGGQEPRTASPAPTPSGSTPPSSPSERALPGPATATSACRSDVELPQVDAAPPLRGTGIRLLVGDRDLRLVDVDAGTTRVVTSPAQLGRGTAVSALARTGGRVLAVLNGECGAGGLGSGRVASVDAETGRLTPAGAGDEILPGTPATVLAYDAPGGRWLLRRLAGGARTPLPEAWSFPLAAAGPSYVMSLIPPNAGAAPPTVGLGDPVTGRLTREFGGGIPVAASEHGVFWVPGGCTPDRCLLARTGLDGVTTAQPVRAEPCCGSVSPDGRWLAFRLPREGSRFGAHPGPPSDVAVLDAQAGRVRVLPGLVLPTKAPTTFAWSADSRWLAIGADLGTTPLVLLWRDGMPRPARVPVEAALGGTAGAPALVLLPPGPS
jgi:hypothetical protein